MKWFPSYGQKFMQLPILLKIQLIRSIHISWFSEFTLFHCLETNEISCGGVTAINVETALFSSNKVSQKCVLEKIVFVPSVLSEVCQKSPKYILWLKNSLIPTSKQHNNGSRYILLFHLFLKRISSYQYLHE